MINPVLISNKQIDAVAVAWIDITLVGKQKQRP